MTLQSPPQRKPILVFTPVNPLRPSVERLVKIHRFNVQQNSSELFDYVEEECVLPSSMQKEGLYRGQNVIRAFNEVYEANKDKYHYICKWDDDMIMQENILRECIIKLNQTKSVGVGLFQEDYGAPNILKVKPRECGWYGAFSRFYMYRMDKWGKIPVVVGGSSGDPDNAYQKNLEGEKHVLNCFSLHLDHRACRGNDDLYRLILDWVGFQFGA